MIEGLSILEKYCGDDIQITEAGNYLSVWNLDESLIDVKEDKGKLLELGCQQSVTNMHCVNCWSTVEDGCHYHPMWHREHGMFVLCGACEESRLRFWWRMERQLSGLVGQESISNRLKLWHDLTAKI